MSDLAEAVLPLIRTRVDLHRWGAANAHGSQMHEAIDLLEQALPTEEPAIVFTVTQKAITSSIKIIARADDSSGIIGDACRRLLKLHPQAAAAAKAPVGKLIDWMMKFQFDSEVDYFELDPVAYAPALGDIGLERYRAKLNEFAASLGSQPSASERWNSPNSHEWWVLEWNARRLAILDHDIEEIIRTHARDRKVAAWFEDTAEAFEEIGEFDLAIDWAKQATDFGQGHQSRAAAGYWCKLLAVHRPDELLNARIDVFRRWPAADTAARLYEDSDTAWPSYRDEVIERLAVSPRDAVLFALLTLKDAQFAWDQAHAIGLQAPDVWERLATAYEKISPLAVLPILGELVENELTEANAKRYKTAARRLKKMRKLAINSDQAVAVDDFITELRQTHRRRPRLQLEFDRAGLP